MTVTYRERPGPMRALLTQPGQPVHELMRAVSTDLRRVSRVVTAERVNRLTGQYERGFEATVEQRPAGPTAVLRNSAGHALILEEGSRPHVIRPRRRGGFLRFRVRGLTVFARSVQHPGTQPYRILGDTLGRVVARYR